MSGILRVSEAASIAMHTMLLLAAQPARTWTTAEIAERLDVSGAHLAKVLQRLSRHGLVRSERGPKGGFRVTPKARQLALLEIYEAIEGPLEDSRCLLTKPVCDGSCCLLGRLLQRINADVRAQLSRVRLGEAARSLA